MKETDIQRQILDFLKFCKVFAWRNNTRTVWVAGRPIKFGIVGAGDIIGVLPGGRFLSIEVKRPKGKAAPAQEQFRDTVNTAGGLAIVARSVEDVAEEIKRAGQKPAPKF